MTATLMLIKKSEMEKLLVVKLSEKNSSIEPEEPTPSITPTPSEIPDISNPKPDNHSTTENPLTTENIGIKGNKIYYKFVDENGTTVFRWYKCKSIFWWNCTCLKLNSKERKYFCIWAQK